MSEERKSAAQRLIELAIDLYEFGVSTEGSPFAALRSMRHIAQPLDGRTFRDELSLAYMHEHGTVPFASSMRDAIGILSARARQEEPEELHLRIAPGPKGSIFLDLGDASGRVVEITARKWVPRRQAPVRFLRTVLTGALPVPRRGYWGLAKLRKRLNLVEDGEWTLLLGWLVAAFYPGVPQPVLVLIGEQGSSKSTMARILVSLIDPSPAPLQSPPRTERDWQVVASGSRLVAIDNLAYVPGWLSDTICRAVTGDGAPSRKLYTDSDIVILAFRRGVILTGIDLTGLKSDLLDRSVVLELAPISSRKRVDERTLQGRFEEERSVILGALLDCVVRSLAQIEAVDEELPRMADYGKVLAALDRAPGPPRTDFLATYVARTIQQQADVAVNDLLGSEITGLATDVGHWNGTASELLTVLEDGLKRRPPKSWPQTPAYLSRRLRLLTPALRAAGTVVEFDRSRDERTIKIYLDDDDALIEAKESCPPPPPPNVAGPPVRGWLRYA